MSGLNISCGAFQADDKSGTAIERVLRDLPGFPEKSRNEILAGFDDGNSTLIAPNVAAELVQRLRGYRDALIAEIGHGDFLREMNREENLGVCSVKLKWGEGRGARLYCAVNLLAACEYSSVSHEPVAIYLD